MSPLKRLIAEIHRRSLWQVLGIYLAGAWIAYEVIWTLTESLGLPSWFPRLAAVLLLVLLPLVLATAFVQEGVRGSEREAAPEPASGVHRRIFTWRKAMLVAVAAFALLGASVTGYMGMRLLGVGPFGTLIAKGALEERDRIVLAEFDNHTSDSLLTLTVDVLLRTSLSESPVVSVAEGDYVDSVLTRMETDPSAPLDYDLAREVAIREGLKAVIAGQIIPSGGGYLLSSRLVAAETGQALWRDTETASDSEAIINAIDRLSRRLRAQVGESLTNVRASPPLEQVTTSSLEALRKYSAALIADSQVERERAVALLDEAIQADSTFAMAYRKLWTLLPVGGAARAAEALRRAFELRHRLTGRERYRIEADYYLGTGQHQRAVTTYQTLLESYPDDASALSGLSYTLSELGEFATAEEYARRAVDLNPSGWITAQILLKSQIYQGKYAEAQETIERHAQNDPESSVLALHRARLAAARGDYETTEAQYRARLGVADTPRDRVRYSWRLAAVEALRGKLSDAERHLGDAVTASGANVSLYFESVALLARFETWLRRDPAAGLRLLEEMEERYPLDTLAPLDRPRPYLQLARVYAFSGQPDRARELLADYDSTVDPELRWYWDATRRREAAGIIALVEEQYQEAITQFRQAMEWPEGGVCVLPLLGRAYDLAGEQDSTLVAFERYVTTPSWRCRTVRQDSRESFWLPVIYERLGFLYEERGDTTKAIHYYSRLIELWGDADLELQPRVEAARRAIRALSPDT